MSSSISFPVRVRTLEWEVSFGSRGRGGGGKWDLMFMAGSVGGVLEGVGR